MRTTIARWESRHGAHYVELYRDAYGYGYTGNDCGGSLGKFANENTAIERMEAKVKTGYFLPDSAKLGMKRTI